MVVLPFIVFGLCVEDGDELDTVCVNHYFASLGKIYGDAPTDVALHLADAPFGTIGVRNERPRDEKGCKRVHVLSSVYLQLSSKGRHMTSNGVDLNSLIGSRICHDLISPLGAIGNGVELLSMSGASAVPEIELIAESAENANARIRFFRVAFGASNETAMIGNAEVRRILADLYRGNRFNVDWRIEDDTRRIEAKLAFLVLQCFESALPWGGKVAVTRSGNTWSIFGSSERLKVEPELWALLSNTSSKTEISASSVHFALVAPTATSAGREVKANFNGNSITVNF